MNMSPAVTDDLRSLTRTCWRLLDPVARDVLIRLGVPRSPLAAHAPEITVAGLAHSTGWPMAAIAEALRTLETADLVYSAHHSESTVWLLTEAGERVVLFGVPQAGKAT